MFMKLKILISEMYCGRFFFPAEIFIVFNILKVSTIVFSVDV